MMDLINRYPMSIDILMIFMKILWNRISQLGVLDLKNQGEMVLAKMHQLAYSNFRIKIS